MAYLKCVSSCKFNAVFQLILVDRQPVVTLNYYLLTTINAIDHHQGVIISIVGNWCQCVVNATLNESRYEESECGYDLCRVR